MPVGADRPVSTSAELPFTLDVPQALDGDDLVRIGVTGAEANALMSDRLEMKSGLSLCCERRVCEEVCFVTGMEEGERAPRRPGYIVCWPESGETAWDIGRRYGVPESAVLAGAPEGRLHSGQPLVLRI